jgi:predicted enzyme related to lactoylglutathione lyase
MSDVERYPPGTFSWVELITTDGAGSRAFYTGLFGWTEETKDGEGWSYTLLRTRGKDVAGLYEMSAEQRAMGIPTSWLSYVTVESADAAVARARELGGQVATGPMDVMENGRMAVLQDPQGAPFAVWEPRAHIGASVANEPVSLVWNELLTRDLDAAGAFYTALFGWTDTGRDMGPAGPYHVFENRGRGAGGMLRIPDGAPAPPAWLPYFAVDDADASVAEVKRRGGSVYVAPMDIPGVGRFAVLGDPQGGTFCVLRLAMDPGPL